MPLNDKVTIIQGDVFEYRFPKGTKFDTIYFDIWGYVNKDIYQEMKRLKLSYRKYKVSSRENPYAFMGCWAEWGGQTEGDFSRMATIVLKNGQTLQDDGKPGWNLGNKEEIEDCPRKRVFTITPTVSRLLKFTIMRLNELTNRGLA